MGYFAQHDKDQSFPLPVMLSEAKSSISDPVPVRNISKEVT